MKKEPKMKTGLWAIIETVLPILAKLVRYFFKWIDDKNQKRVNRESDVETQEEKIRRQERKLETDTNLQKLREGLNWFVDDYVLTEKQRRRRHDKEVKKKIKGN